jgi:hypothetical protein
MILWYMSQKRIMCLSLTEFRPISLPKTAYFDLLGKDLAGLTLNKEFKKLCMHKDELGTLTIK